jgi:hypothetical protein
VAVGLSALLSVGVAALVAGWIIAQSVVPIGPGSALGGSLVVSPPHHASRSLHGSHPRFASNLSGPGAGAVTSASISQPAAASPTEPGSGRHRHCRLCQVVKATGLFKTHPKKAIAHTLRALARGSGHGGGNGHGNGNGNGRGRGDEVLEILDDRYLPAARYLQDGGIQIMDEDVHVIVRRSDEVDVKALRASNGDGPQ